jgi:tetratricopeptide (TPR) repeat protein
MFAGSILLMLLILSPQEELDVAEPVEEGATPPPSGSPIGEAALCGRGEYRLDDGSKEALLHGKALFEVAVVEHPEASCAHAGLSRALVSIYQRHIAPDDATLELAIREAEEAVRLSPGSPVAHAALATALMADLRAPEADEHAAIALDLDPDSVPALQAAALARLALHTRASAREAADRALELRPDLPALHLLDGNLHLLGREPFEAIAAYRRALLLSPDLLPAAFQQAAAYEYAGNFRKAAAIFDRLLEEHPDEEAAIIHLYMGQSLMQRKSWRAALAVLKKADFKRSKGLCNGTVLHLEATCLERLGRTSEAIEAHETIIHEWPGATRSFINPERLVFESYIALGRLHLQAGALDEAVRIMEEGARLPDASLELVLTLARVYDEYRLYPEALRLLETAVAREPNERNARDLLAAHVLWARMAAKSGEPEGLLAVRASLHAKSGAIAGMGDFSHDLQLARAFSIAGDVEGSLDSIERAVQGGYTHLGWIASDPEFEPIRGAERYDRLMASTGDSGRN